jgi:RNA-binding protein
MEQNGGGIVMLNSKERAALRAQANGLPVILQVGKLGLSDALREQADGALRTRELIKGGVLENAPLTAREAAHAIAGQTGSEVVQVIGSKFVLYRENPEKRQA